MDSFAASTETPPRPRVERAERARPARAGNSGRALPGPQKKPLVDVVVIAVKSTSSADPPSHPCHASFGLAPLLRCPPPHGLLADNK